MIDNKLNLKDHIKHVHSKISKAIFSINQMKHILDQKHLKLLAGAYIRSHIEYCCNIFTLCYDSTLKPLEVIYKRMIRTITGKPRFTHTPPLFFQEEILPLKSLIEFRVAKFTHQALNNNKFPFYGLWKKNREREGYNLRDLDNIYLQDFRLHMFKMHPYFSFPRIWNNIDNELKNVQDHTEFCIELKQHLLDKLVMPAPAGI